MKQVLNYFKKGVKIPDKFKVANVVYDQVGYNDKYILGVPEKQNGAVVRAFDAAKVEVP